MKFIVDRKMWYRGKGSNESMLLRDDGMRCCIGFVGKQCGIPDNVLLDKPTVHSVRNHSDHSYEDSWPKWFYGDIDQAYRSNDNRLIDDSVREGQLMELFRYHGDEIEFVD